MSLDARLRDAGEAAAAYVPSPDLLDRVTGSIAEHASHRGRVRRTAGPSPPGCWRSPCGWA